jgi:hypothetical protein
MTRIKSIVLPFVQIYPKVFRLMWRANGWRLAAAIALTVLGAFSGPLQIWISAVAIDRIVQAVLGGLGTANPASIMVPLAGFAIIWAIGQMAASLNTSLSEIMLPL